MNGIETRFMLFSQVLWVRNQDTFGMACLFKDIWGLSLGRVKG